jgi:glycerophosphoryl diester phosphodiesterase
LLALSLAAAIWAAGLINPEGAAAGTGCVPPPVAHRGDSARAPENTLPAFRKALRLGVHRLELDVRFTLGDVPVLMHDTTVDRTTNGTGAIADLTLDQLRSLDAGRWFAPAYRGTRVPTLYQALKLAQRSDAQVMVDLKPRPTGSAGST